jgi:hypothetical protein
LDVPVSVPVLKETGIQVFTFDMLLPGEAGDGFSWSLVHRFGNPAQAGRAPYFGLGLGYLKAESVGYGAKGVVGINTNSRSYLEAGYLTTSSGIFLLTAGHRF